VRDVAIQNPIRVYVPWKRLPSATGPGGVCSTATTAGFQPGSLLTSARKLKTSATGRAIRISLAIQITWGCACAGGIFLHGLIFSPRLQRRGDARRDRTPGVAVSA
jgi:hypothetical protein